MKSHKQALSIGGPTTSIVEIVRTEWMYWIGGSIAAYLVANILMSGLGSGPFPELRFPYIYKDGGDDLFSLWIIQRLVEGSLFENARGGYPFPSTLHDFPSSDFANHFLLKLLASVGGNFQSAFNLYFLLGFAVTYAVTYVVFRGLGVEIPLALAGAFVFDFLPFHFMRLNLGHLFFTWYFVVPLFFYAGFLCFKAGSTSPVLPTSLWKFLLVAFSLIIAASFGVYGAFFGVIVVLVCGVMGTLAYKRPKPIVCAVACAAAITSGVILNVSPNIIYLNSNGPNVEVAQRSPVESEIYGLKLMQLIIPRAGHRNDSLSEVAAKYNRSYPLVNENNTSALGIVGATGLVALFLVLVTRIAGARVDERLALLAALVLVLFLFGTVGGLGALFSLVVSPLIRAWNRISVFIGFGAIGGLLLITQLIVQRILTTPRAKSVILVISAMLVVVAFYDQTTPVCSSCLSQTQKNFENDRKFVRSIEEQLAPDSAVYQLPYMPFPEVPPRNALRAYDLMIGFLHSESLKWSYAGNKGRAGDHFYRALVEEPIEFQIKVLRKLGFSGIYVDRRGYQDNGQDIIEALKVTLGGGPSIEHADGTIAFFRLEGSAKDVSFDGLDAFQIMRRAGYHAKLGRLHSASLAEGIDLTRNSWPSFLRNVTGLSIHESWGRWSDATVASTVKFHFFEPLPKFGELVIELKAFGPNVGENLEILIGTARYEVRLPKKLETIRVPFENPDDADFIELYPPRPTSPKEIGLSPDGRKLGIGLTNIRFNER